MGLLSKIGDKLTGNTSERDDHVVSEHQQEQPSSISHPFQPSSSDNAGTTSTTLGSDSTTHAHNPLSSTTTSSATGSGAVPGAFPHSSTNTGVSYTSNLGSSVGNTSAINPGHSVGGISSGTLGQENTTGLSHSSLDPDTSGLGATTGQSSAIDSANPTSSYTSGYGLTSGTHTHGTNAGLTSGTQDHHSTGFTSSTNDRHTGLTSTIHGPSNTGLNSSTRDHNTGLTSATQDYNTGLTSSTRDNDTTLTSSTHDHNSGLTSSIRKNDNELTSDTRADNTGLTYGAHGGNISSGIAGQNTSTGTGELTHDGASKPVAGGGPDTGPKPSQENNSAIPTAGGQKVGTGVDAPETAYGAQPQRGEDHTSSRHHGHSHGSHHESHTARNTALAAGAGTGVAFAGDHERNKKHDHHSHHTHEPSSNITTGQTGQTSAGLSSFSSQPSEQRTLSSIQQTGQHHGDGHHTRDTAIDTGVAAGVGGLAAHELGRSHDHSSQASTLPGQQTSQTSYLPGQHSSSLDTQSGLSSGSTLGIDNQTRAHDGVPGTATLLSGQHNDPLSSSITHTNRTTGGSTDIPPIDFQSGGPSGTSQGASHLTSSGVGDSTTTSSELPHRQKHSHLGTGAGLVGGAGLSDVKHHERRHDSGNQHVLPSHEKPQLGGTELSGIGESTTPAHIEGLRHAQTRGGEYESGYRAALAHLKVNTDGLL